MPKDALCWLRRDLRLSDNAVLATATAASERVTVCFVFDTELLARLADRADRRVTFIHRSLAELHRKLAAHGASLVVKVGDPVVEVPRLAAELGVDTVIAGRDPEPEARRRDAAVEVALAGRGIRFNLVKDQTVFEGDEILNREGQPFRVFTPFLRAWRGALEDRNVAECVVGFERLRRGPVDPPDAWSLERLGFREADLPTPAGEDAAKERLAAFAARMGAYAEERDYPAVDGTSGLSVHLRFGTLSVRAAVRAALEQNSEGARKWLDELVWREFYQSILWHFPEVAEDAFQERFRGRIWPGSEEHFEAWCAGRTGYPLVDAAMRCLNATGWMHNRLRMVTASFLTKDLLVDWRKGEAYFAEKLLDYDLASNNGGWQWSASTGCDAQPYFRIFNPTSQALRYDPRGEFVRRWCPDLAAMPDAEVHRPSPGRYLSPIVDHSEQRAKALALFAAWSRA